MGKTLFHYTGVGVPWKHPHGRGEDHIKRTCNIRTEETPPRAWGRLDILVVELADRRNTPTGVGKTSKTQRAKHQRQKHPHGRGEDSGGVSAVSGVMETPPRAWGRPLFFIDAIFAGRNTPTGVGKTSPRHGRPNKG